MPRRMLLAASILSLAPACTVGGLDDDDGDDTPLIGAADPGLEAPASCGALVGDSPASTDASSYYYCSPRPRGVYMSRFSDGSTYSYSTGGEADSFPVATTKDLVNWNFVDADAKPKGADWQDPADRDYWPMEVIERNGRYYMFYAANANPANRPPPDGCNNNHFIGLAIADDPKGPFIDIGRPLMAGSDFEEDGVPWGRIRTVDPNPFVDADGNVYLYWSKPGGCYSYFNARVGSVVRESRIYGARLSDDLTQLATKPRLLLKPEQDWELDPDKKHFWNEAPEMVKRGARYYLMYSGNGYTTGEYAVGYATSLSPLGDFTKYNRNPILQKIDGIQKAGHHSIVPSPDGRDLYASYQTFEGRFISRLGRRHDGSLYINGPYADISAADGGVRFLPKPSGAVLRAPGGTVIGTVFDHSRDATVRASSTAAGTRADAVVDGEIGVRPRLADEAWVADGERVGAWVELTWSTPREVDTIAIYPPGDGAAIQRGRLTLDDGTVVRVIFPADDKAPAIVSTGRHTISRLHFTATDMRAPGPATLSEIAVLGPPL